MDEYFGDSSGDGSSSLTSSILDSITQLGQTAIIATQTPNIQTSYPYGPPITAYNPITSTPRSSSTSLLLFVALAVGAYFVFVK